MIENRRIINLHLNIYIVLVCFLMGTLGLFLLISLDDYEFRELTCGILQYSVYTVYTQFGFFIFPIFAILFICEDYKNCNIAFYQLLGIDIFKYFIGKLKWVMIYLSIGNLIVAISSCILFVDFSHFVYFFLKIENVTLYIMMVSMTISMFLKKTMLSYCANFGLWVGSIILSTTSKYFSVLCFFDASLYRHKYAESIFNGEKIDNRNILLELAYNIVVFSLVSVGVRLNRKRWGKYGI